MSSITVPCETLRQRMHYLTTTEFWQHRYRQAEALELVAENENLIVVAKDKVNSERAAREYYAGTIYSLWRSMLRLPPNLRNYYEWITDRHPCHMYIDMEYYPQFNENDDEYPFEHRRRIMLEMVLEQIGAVCDAERVHVFESDASKKSKWSRHYVLHVEGHLFKNQFHCGALQRRVQLEAIRRYGPPLANPYFAWVHGADHKSRVEGTAAMAPVMDHGVYTRSRLLRVTWATKWRRDEYRPLIPKRRWVATRMRAAPHMDVDAPDAWTNVTGDDECEEMRCENPLNPDLQFDVFLEGLVQAYTERFLAGCADGQCKIIETREPDGREPLSTTILMTSGARGRTVSRRGLGNVAHPGLLEQGLMENTTRVGVMTEKELLEKHGESAKISHAQASAIRAALPSMKLRLKPSRAADADASVDEDEPEHPHLDAQLTAFTADEALAVESAALCVAAIDEIVELRQKLNVVTRPERVRYYHNFGSSLVFWYQLESGFCEICKYEHSSNHVTVVVQLQPFSDYCDEAHPNAPVYYFKCYKQASKRTPPRALPSYLANPEMRKRVDALRDTVNSSAEIRPREFLAFLLASSTA